MVSHHCRLYGRGLSLLILFLLALVAGVLLQVSGGDGAAVVYQTF